MIMPPRKRGRGNFENPDPVSGKAPNHQSAALGFTKVPAEVREQVSKDTRIFNSILTQVGKPTLKTVGARVSISGKTVRGSPFVQFKTSKRNRQIRVISNPDDTYAVELWYVRGGRYPSVKRLRNVSYINPSQLSDTVKELALQD